ncbi:MAG: hypothetical protein R3352_05785 [Salinisphaeraceae bacterium]|nr:hypothetical protein [Salinisphaeraceae bacterium]
MEMPKTTTLTLISLLLLTACGGGSSDSDAQDSASNSGTSTANAGSEIICPDELAAVELETAPEYDSWLSMKGGGYGHVQREWHNGCYQQLSFPADADNNPPYNEPQADYKPNWSPDGKHITFFRRYFSFEGVAQEQLTLIGDNVIPNWITQVMVMNAEDGSDVRPVTEDEYLHVNPMWTRKKYPNKAGEMAYRVTFTRGKRDPNFENLPTIIPRTGGAGAEVCWADVDGLPGEERCFTDLSQGSFFGYSSLKDGRMLVRIEETREMALITPNDQDPTQTKFEVLDYEPQGTLEEAFGMPILHKVTISPDETKIAYMKVDPALQNAGSADAFAFAVIAYADLDIKNLTISNEVVVSDPIYNYVNIEWYPSWSHTNKQLLFACSGTCPYWEPAVPINWYTDNSQIVEYDLETGNIRRISHDLDVNYRYPAVWGTVK